MSEKSTSSGMNWGEAFKHIKYVPKIPMEVCLHPEVYNKLVDGLPKVEYKSLHSLYGMKITISEHIPKHPKKWEFPKCRFVEYEEKDEEWARPVGHGREVDDTSQYIGFEIKTQEYLTKHLQFNTNKELEVVACSGIITGYPYEKFQPFRQIDFAGKGSYYPANIITCDSGG